VNFARITRDAKVQYAPEALECQLKRSLLKTSTGRKPACSLQRNRIEIGPPLRIAARTNPRSLFGKAWFFDAIKLL
jgi:hypothetical protein